MLETALIAVTMFCLALVRGASGVFNMVSPRHDPNLFTVVSATLTTYVTTTNNEKSEGLE